MLDIIFHNCFENLIKSSVSADVDIFISLKKKEGLSYTKTLLFIFSYTDKRLAYTYAYTRNPSQFIYMHLNLSDKGQTNN